MDEDTEKRLDKLFAERDARDALAQPPPFWTAKERFRLAQHLTACLRRLGSDPTIKFLLTVMPEHDFLIHPDPEMAGLMVSIQGNWSVWLRETWNGAPRPYRVFVDDAIRAVARLMPYDQFLGETIEAVYTAQESGTEPQLPDHPSHPAEMRLKTRAMECGVLHDDPPADLAALFAEDRLHTHLAQRQ